MPERNDINSFSGFYESLVGPGPGQAVAPAVTGLNSQGVGVNNSNTRVPGCPGHPGTLVLESFTPTRWKYKVDAAGAATLARARAKPC